MKLKPRRRGIAQRVSLQWWGARAGSFVFMAMAVLIFTFSAVSPGNVQTVRTQAVDLFAPVLAAVNAPVVYASDYVRAVTGLAEMQAENARLRQENARLREWYQTAMYLQTENESLKDLLNIKLPSQHHYITARVIADSGNTFAKSLLVLAGSGEGVENSDAVLAGEGLIGRVIETGRKASRILLLTDINSRIPVLIQGPNHRAILAGNNDGTPRLMHLPPESEIAEGARVMTSGHGGLFPYGLPVGTIVKNEKGELVVEPYTDIDRISFVRIIDKAEDPLLRQNTQ